MISQATRCKARMNPRILCGVFCFPRSVRRPQADVEGFAIRHRRRTSGIVSGPDGIRLAQARNIPYGSAWVPHLVKMPDCAFASRSHRVIIKPKVRGFICITAHPVGCEHNVLDQIAITQAAGHDQSKGPKRVLVIGASTGYGLASRITAAFGSGAAPPGVFFEKPSSHEKTGTAGWYNPAAFGQAPKHRTEEHTLGLQP